MLGRYRVLDLTEGGAQLAGYTLAQLGADVIAIEAAGIASDANDSDEVAARAYQRGKRSVSVDLLTSEGQIELRRLVAGADVLIESARPGALTAIGIGPDALLDLNPALVHASLTPFGSTGPRAQWHATDLTIMASCGALALTGDADRPPLRVSAPQGMRFAGAAGASAIVLALLDRARTGRGQHIDVSAQQVAALATQAGLLSAAVNAPVPSRTAGGARVGPLALQLVYPALDGHVSITHVFGPAIGPATAALLQWAHEEGHCSADLVARDWVLFPVLVDQGLESVETFNQSKSAIAALTSSKTKLQLLAGARERRLLVAPIAAPVDVMNDEHLGARGYYDEIEVGGRSVRAPGSFVRPTRTGLRPLGPPPRRGAHTLELAEEFSRAPLIGPAWGNATADGPLVGLKVLDFTWSIAGPHATRVLADHGATVVKIESQTKMDAARGFMPIHDNEPGAERSALFDDMNAGKQSLTLDLNRPESLDVIRDLVAWADVVTESYSPRAMRGWGLAYEDLAKINPSIIMISTCLTGQTGPLAGLAGYGNLGAALAGFYGLGRWPDRPPAGPFGAYTDYTSTHFMATAVLAALDHRRFTGEGQYLDMSQAEAAMQFLVPELLAAAVSGSGPEPIGNDDPAIAPHGVYPAAGDDKWVAIACQSDEAWPALCQLLGRPDLEMSNELSNAAGRLGARRRLDEAIVAWSASRDADAAAVALQAAGVAAYRVQNSPECLTDPQLIHRGHFVDLEHPSRGCI
ncbi:MAG: CoA transferase, partial [Actinomycetota bacterium]|nr:CoA transferase [Actinomycetota bacterium]